MAYGTSESHSRTAKEFARRITVVNLGASDAEPTVCSLGMGSLQGAHGSLVESRSANVQASRLFPFPTQSALFPDWWMNEGGKSATGEVSVSTPRAHVVAHNRSIGFRQLIQFMITTHPALKKQAEEAKKPSHVSLERPWKPFAKMREWKPP